VSAAALRGSLVDMAHYFTTNQDIFKKEDSEIDNSGNEDSDDSAFTEELQHARTKKPINKGRWSKEEDARLKQLVEEYNEKWDVIAELFPDRSDVQCQQRWTKVVNPELVKGPWTKEVSVTRFNNNQGRLLSSTFVDRPRKERRDDDVSLPFRFVL
jgi:hypothetical protein